MATARNVLSAQPEMVAGIVVFIDDNTQILVDERNAASSLGCKTVEIREPGNLEPTVAAIFAEAERLRLPYGKIVFFIDNRMNEFARHFTTEHPVLREAKVVHLSDLRGDFGERGKYMGMAIAEWLARKYGEKKRGFRIAILSAFGPEGVSRRIDALKAQYPGFLGHRFKVSSTARKADRAEHLKQIKLSISSAIGGGADSLVRRASQSGYPFAKVLLVLANDLKFSREDIANFLRLSDVALDKVDSLLKAPEKFELDTVSWKERVSLAEEIVLMLEEDHKTIERLNKWLDVPNELTRGLAPKRVIVDGSMRDLLALRNAIKFDL